MDDIDKMSREELIDYINKLNRTLSKIAEEKDNADTVVADLAIELEQCFPYPRDANGYSIKVGDGLDWNGVHGICVGYEWYKNGELADECSICFMNDDGDVDYPRHSSVVKEHMRYRIGE